MIRGWWLSWLCWEESRSPSKNTLSNRQGAKGENEEKHLVISWKAERLVFWNVVWFKLLYAWFCFALQQIAFTPTMQFIKKFSFAWCFGSVGAHMTHAYMALFRQLSGGVNNNKNNKQTSVQQAVTPLFNADVRESPVAATRKWVTTWFGKVLSQCQEADSAAPA